MKKIFKLIALFAFSMLLNGSLHAKTYEVVTFDEIQEIKKGKTKSYITSKGETFSVGQTIKLGFAFRNEQYDYIIQSPLGGMAVYPLSNIAAGSEVKIKKISWRKKLTRVMTTKPDGMVYTLAIINLEGALQAGEIISSIISRKEAIEKLKEAKDLLDLDLMTKDEYNSLKIELTPIIREE